MKILALSPVLLLLLFQSQLRSLEPDVVAKSHEEAQGLAKIFATTFRNEVEPLNWKEFNQLYLLYGGPIYGKAFLQFDIGEDGKPANLKVLARNVDLLFGPRIKKLFETKLQFEPGKPRKDVVFEVGFCERVLCNLYFERVGGPEEPLITGYRLPFSDLSTFNDSKTKINTLCSDVTVRFDVNKKGRAENVEIVSQTEGEYHGKWLVNNFSSFKFEKKKPAQGIEMVVRFELMEHCNGRSDELPAH